ncbi:MAG: MFS transporter, partial [Clostridia bacterium]|nr:MFS transporter [Clostridia bacterium]
SLLGSAWPLMRLELGAPLSFAGVISMLIACGTIVSSLLSDRLTRRFGAAKVTACSVVATAVALLGFSKATQFWMLVAWAVPLGLGAGAVDAALNNFVALHFSSRHMSWLHCFWGLGASVSPYIMGFFLSRELRWDRGYLTVGLIQLALSAVLFASLPLWKKASALETQEEARTAPKTLRQIAALPGICYVLFGFFAYCALEAVAFTWTSTYLVNVRALAPESAARFASLFYLGMTVSRFLAGFIADRLGDRKMIRLGFFVCFMGLLLVMLPVSSPLPCLVGLTVAGFGCGPVYPSIIHATPAVFGKENSQAVVGVQMASAYCGSTFMPPVFGWVAGAFGLRLFPFALVLFAVVGFTLTELLNRKVKTS